MTEINGCQTDDQRDCRNNLEVYEALQGHTPDAAQVAVPGDSSNQSSHDQWRNKDGDQPQKYIAQNPKVFAEMRPIEANFTAQQHGEKNPIRERRTPTSA